MVPHSNVSSGHSEDQRATFSLYVDEFQNFAIDSFESILSEARKYKLSLISVRTVYDQLTDKIREAIIKTLVQLSLGGRCNGC